MAKLKGILAFREEVLRRALRDKKIHDASFRVLVAMIGLINGEEFNRTERAQCWPGIGRLAVETGKSVATVKRALAELVREKVISKEARGTKLKSATLEISLRWLGGQGELPLPIPENNQGSIVSPHPGANGTASGLKLSKIRAQIEIRSIDESDEEKIDKKEGSANALPSGANPRRVKAAKLNGKGSRLPDGWTLPDDWREAAVAARIKFELAPVNLDLQAELFRNHWYGKSGHLGTKKDWRATWINWALRAEAPRSSAFAGKPQHLTPEQRKAAIAEGIRRAREEPTQ